MKPFSTTHSSKSNSYKIIGTITTLSSRKQELRVKAYLDPDHSDGHHFFELDFQDMGSGPYSNCMFVITAFKHSLTEKRISDWLYPLVIQQTKFRIYSATNGPNPRDVHDKLWGSGALNWRRWYEGAPPNGHVVDYDQQEKRFFFI